MKTYKIYLIRHGMTKANMEGRYIGVTDTDLCEEGVNEIVALKEKYEYPKISIVYSSPLKRALQTARLIYPDIKPITVKKLRECNFGDFENKLLGDLKDNEQFKEWLKSGLESTPPNGESMNDIRERVLDGFDMVIKDMMKNGQTEAALFTHGGVIMALLTLCGLPKRQSTEWSVCNGMGYTALVNASLWGNNKSFEVFTPIPYGTNKENVMMDYQKAFFDEEMREKISEEVEGENL